MINFVDCEYGTINGIKATREQAVECLDKYPSMIKNRMTGYMSSYYCVTTMYNTSTCYCLNGITSGEGPSEESIDFDNFN